MITYDTIPVYNYSLIANTGQTTAIWTDAFRKLPVWTCADWIEWFEELKKQYSESTAKSVWKYFWSLGVSKSGGGMGDIRAGSGLIYDSVPLDCRTFNTDFRNFLSKYNLNDAVYTGLGNIAIPIGAGVDVVKHIAGAVGSVASGIDTTGKVLKYAIPALFIAGVGLLLIYGYKKAQKG